MLVQRIFTTFILIAITVVAILDKWFFAIVATLLIIYGLYELYKMVENKGIYIYKYFGIIIGTVIPLSIVWNFELTKNWEFLFIVLGLLALFLLQFTRRQNSQAVLGISTTIFGILYISWLFSFIIRIRLLPDGSAFVASLILITKSSDIGAYLIGSRWGKRTLIARISPGKTIEGTLGGLLFGVLAAMASKCFLPNIFAFTYFRLIFIGAFFGLLGQLGDLSESLIKRDCQIKDSGNVLPGMGGVLDLIDSLLFTSPAYYFYISTVLKIAK
jgi:phosphatidate cytidylyltransferase